MNYACARIILPPPFGCGSSDRRLWKLVEINSTRSRRELFSVIASKMYFYVPQRGELPCWGCITIDPSGPATAE